MVTSSHCLLWQAFLTLILLVLLRCSVRAMLLAKVVLPEVARLVVLLMVLLMVQKVAVLNLYLLKSKGIELI